MIASVLFVLIALNYRQAVVTFDINKDYLLVLYPLFSAH